MQHGVKGFPTSIYMAPKLKNPRNLRPLHIRFSTKDNLYPHFTVLGFYKKKGALISFSNISYAILCHNSLTENAVTSELTTLTRCKVNVSYLSIGNRRRQGISFELFLLSKYLINSTLK